MNIKVDSGEIVTTNDSTVECPYCGATITLSNTPEHSEYCPTGECVCGATAVIVNWPSLWPWKVLVSKGDA